MDSCYILAISDSGARLRKAKYDRADRIGKVGFLWMAKPFAIPADVEGIPFKKSLVTRTKALFVVDVRLWCALPIGKTVTLDPDFKSRLELLSRDKLWRLIGSKAQSLLEMLLTMAAGYGVLRWLEYFVTTVVGK